MPNSTDPAWKAATVYRVHWYNGDALNLYVKDIQFKTRLCSKYYHLEFLRPS